MSRQVEQQSLVLGGAKLEFAQARLVFVPCGKDRDVRLVPFLDLAGEKEGERPTCSSNAGTREGTTRRTVATSISSNMGDEDVIDGAMSEEGTCAQWSASIMDHCPSVVKEKTDKPLKASRNSKRSLCSRRAIVFEIVLTVLAAFAD